MEDPSVNGETDTAQRPSGARLAGKRAFVTGGGRGIGAMIASRFREEGARVVVADLVAGDVVCDVRSRESIEGAMDEAARRMGGIDTLVCNAGIPTLGAVHELEEEDWDQSFAVNVKHVFLCAKAAWSHLVETRGSITSTASVVGLQGSMGQAAYCAAKAGVVLLTKCMAMDGGRVGVRANCVCPGFIETQLVAELLSGLPDPNEARARFDASQPLGRPGRPRDIADGFVYLASDEAQWITGTTLVIDGGLTSGQEVFSTFFPGSKEP